MTRTLYIALCAACILAIASSAAVTTSLTASAFAAAPGKVFDGSTGAADVATWGTYTGAIFGPGTANTTVYAYGWKLNAAGTSITAVVSRALNATLLSNGTADTTLASKVGDDAVYSTAITISGTPQTAVGLGSFAVAYTATDAATVACSQVYVSIFAGGTAAPTTKAVTAYTCSICTAGTATTVGVGYTNTVGNVFYDNKTYWVTYTSTKFTQQGTGTNTDTCSATPPLAAAAGASPGAIAINGQVTSYIQGVTTAGALAWTAATTVIAGAAGSSGAVGAYASPGTTCSPGNWTNATTFLCAYASSSSTIAYIPITVATGVAGSAATIATDVTASGSYPQTGTTYTVAGFVRSQYQQGIFINKRDTITASSGGAVTYANTLMLYNLTSGASAVAGGVTTNITNTYQSGIYGATGLSASSGFGVVDNYNSASGVYTYEWGTWFANGTVNATKATFASGAGTTANVFIDANGALWAGAYSVDDTANPDTLTTGYLGKLVSQVYSSTYGNVLVTFFGLISLVIAALFVF